MPTGQRLIIDMVKSIYHMQYRSIPDIKRRTVITIGLYAIFWFIQTRNEMVRKYGAKIPSGFWLIICATVLIPMILYILFAFLPSVRQEISSPSTPTQMPKTCFVEYMQSKESTSEASATTSPECLGQIEAYENQPRQGYRDNYIVIIIVAFIILPLLLAIFWIKPYINAVHEVLHLDDTEGRNIAKSITINPVRAMLRIQEHINNRQNSPERMDGRQPSTPTGS